MSDHRERFARDIARKADRKDRARRTRDRDIWSWLGMFGLVGWSVAAPTLAGVALGLWLDERFPGKASWTLTLLLIGIVLGCMNAWVWIKRESKDE